jgi:hypothetical protein
MKSLKNIFLAAMIILWPLSCLAQMSDQAEVREINEKYDLGLSRRPSLPFIDISRLDMTQSYSIGFYSGGGFSGTQALYSNTITYQLAKPLTLTLNLSILHDPGALWSDKSLGNTATFLPSGRLDWRPSDNFRMSIGIETRPAYYNGDYYNSGRYRFWRE